MVIFPTLKSIFGIFTGSNSEPQSGLTQEQIDEIKDSMQKVDDDNNEVLTEF